MKVALYPPSTITVSIQGHDRTSRLTSGIPPAWSGTSAYVIFTASRRSSLSCCATIRGRLAVSSRLSRYTVHRDMTLSAIDFLAAS